MLRAITFDLWETLIHEDPAAETQRREYRLREIGRILDEHHVSVAPEALARAHQEVLTRMDPYWGANLDISILEQTKLFIEIATGVPVDGRLPAPALLEASKHYGEAALKHPPRAAEGVRGVLAATRAAGLRMALLCNTGRTPGKVLRDILETLELKLFFDALCFSDEVRLRKPAAEFFTRALNRMNVRPDEAVHVGDQPETDLAGARSAGMLTVHLRRPSAPPAPAGAADFTIAAITDLPAILGKLIAAPPPKPGSSSPRTPRPSDFGRETQHL